MYICPFLLVTSVVSGSGFKLGAGFRIQRPHLKNNVAICPGGEKKLIKKLEAKGVGLTTKIHHSETQLTKNCIQCQYFLIV